MAKEKGLGKGVELLFGEDVSDDEVKYFMCDVGDIVPNKYQPRYVFKDEDLKELSDSIRENGIIQPLVVKKGVDDLYELIAGERRLRASKLIGLEQVPVVLYEVNEDNNLLELALIENIQRTDLNAIEEAEAYNKLKKDFGYTQEKIATRVGKNRSTIANLLRLLQLPQFIRDDVSNGMLSEGHARALLRLDEDQVTMKEIRDLILANNLSVRQTESLVKKSLGATVTQTTSGNSKRKNGKQEGEIPLSYCNALVNQLTNKLQSKVKIIQNGTRGKLEIEYYSTDDLERLISVLSGD